MKQLNWKITRKELKDLAKLLCIGLFSLHLYGCVSQQADLKQVDRDLQKRIKQSTEELAQTRARQNQEISLLREAVQGLEARQEDILKRMNHNSTPPRMNVTMDQSAAKNCEMRLDQHDELITSLLMQLQELSKTINAMKSSGEIRRQ
jgi:hypothetical protein